MTKSGRRFRTDKKRYFFTPHTLYRWHSLSQDVMKATSLGDLKKGNWTRIWRIALGLLATLAPLGALIADITRTQSSM